MTLLEPCRNATQDHCARHREGATWWRLRRYSGPSYRIENYQCWDFIPGQRTKGGQQRFPDLGKRCSGSRRRFAKGTSK